MKWTKGWKYIWASVIHRRHQQRDDAMWTEDMNLRKTLVTPRCIEPLPSTWILHPYIPSRIFPCTQSQQSRGLMVRPNQNKSHQFNKGARMYKQIKRKTVPPWLPTSTSTRAKLVPWSKANQDKIIQETLTEDKQITKQLKNVCIYRAINPGNRATNKITPGREAARASRLAWSCSMCGCGGGSGGVADGADWGGVGLLMNVD